MLILVVGGCAGVVSAGAVQQNVTGTEIGQHLPVNGLKKRAVKHVGFISFTDKARVSQLSCQSGHSLLIQVKRRHLGARPGKGSDHGTADKTAGAGNHHDLIRIIDMQR